MGFVLSILYFLTYYLTPTTIFGPLAEYRVEFILALLAIIASIPKLSDAFVMKTPQFIALAGLGFATAVSVVVGAHWFVGGLYALLQFIPNAFAYFLVCVHCNTRKRLKTLVAMLLLVCFFVIAQGWNELQQGPTPVVVGDRVIGNTPYLFTMRNDEGEFFYRLRGLGEINDPNDFAQVLVCVVPLVFIFWRPKRGLRNVGMVLVPVGVLIYGIFLTHSRGALLALVVMLLVTARRRTGTIPALVAAALMFVVASALNFAGDRQISANAGQDRLGLWGAGLQLLKGHPLFGVGFNRMPENVGMTAHNSVVVCAAELGFIGLLFWSMFLFSTFRDAILVGSPEKLTEGNLPIEEDLIFTPKTPSPELLSKSDISRIGRLILLSLTGFLVTGWFLSRAFVVTLFLLGGMAEVVYQMAVEREMIAPRWSLSRVFPYAGALAVSMIVLMYLMVRLGNVMR